MRMTWLLFSESVDQAFLTHSSSGSQRLMEHLQFGVLHFESVNYNLFTLNSFLDGYLISTRKSEVHKSSAHRQNRQKKSGQGHQSM